MNKLFFYGATIQDTNGDDISTKVMENNVEIKSHNSVMKETYNAFFKLQVSVTFKGHQYIDTKDSPINKYLKGYSVRKPGILSKISKLIYKIKEALEKFFFMNNDYLRAKKEHQDSKLNLLTFTNQYKAAINSNRTPSHLPSQKFAQKNDEFAKTNLRKMLKEYNKLATETLLLQKQQKQNEKASALPTTTS